MRQSPKRHSVLPTVVQDVTGETIEEKETIEMTVVIIVTIVREEIIAMSGGRKESQNMIVYESVLRGLW